MPGNDYFEREIPGARVALKRGTPDVPADGRFHLVVAGRIEKSIRSRVAANFAFKEAVAASGWVPNESDKRPDFGQLYADQFFAEHEAYWSRSSSFTPKGGKGR